jgi:hypothetical protein
VTRLHGRHGAVYLAAVYGGLAAPVSFQAAWSVNVTPAKADVTTMPDKRVLYVASLPDYSGDFSGWYDDATAQTYSAVTDGLPRSFYLYPSILEQWRYFYGLILPDFSAGAGVEAAQSFKATWVPASAFGQSGGHGVAAPDGGLDDAGTLLEPARYVPPPWGRPVVTFLGAPGTFYQLGNLAQTPSGHSFRIRSVAGWQTGPGLQIFYSRATQDGQVILTTLPLSANELKPTMATAEIWVYSPLAGTFTRQVIPTSAGALTTVNPSNGLYGGTDVGSGDCVIITDAAGSQRAVLTCEGYYFNWSIPTYGLYPALAFLTESGGAWSYNAADSLTGDQWEATNPTAFGTLAPSGKTAGNGATYWSPAFPGQMAVLPRSNRIVIGHYFPGTGSGSNAGMISVIDADGNLQAAYQVPNITPASGSLTTAAVRDVESDPSSVLGDERFVVIYDAFGTGVHATIQEFSYNATGSPVVLANGVTVPAGGIAPVSVPCSPADTGISVAFAWIDAKGTLYVSCGQQSNGLLSANLQVYRKIHSNGRSLASSTAATGTWASSGTWPTPVDGDRSLGFPVGLGLGGLAGPMLTDEESSTLCVPGLSGRLGLAAPNGIPLDLDGPNLLPAVSSGFEPPNLLETDDQIFATSRGTWVPFLGSFTGPSAPPVAPPAGVNGMHMVEALSSLIGQSAKYSVAASTQYEFAMSFLATTTVRTCEIWVQYFTSAGASLGTSAHVTGADNASTWTTLKSTVTTPATAAMMQLFFQVDAAVAAEVHWLAANFLRCLDAGITASWTSFLTTIGLTDAQALDGSYSLLIKAPFNSETLSATSPKFPVIPYQEYKAQAWFRANTTGQKVSLLIRWFNAAGSTFTTDAACTMTATDSSSGWVLTRCCAMAPPGAVTAALLLEPVTSVTGEIHYADRVTVVQQPWSSQPYVDFILGTLRGQNDGSVVGTGRPCLVWPYLFIPVPIGFTAAESTAFASNSYTPAPKPQYLVAVDLSQLIVK